MIAAKCSSTLPACYNISIFKGDTLKETFKLRDANKDPIDLTGSAITFTVKKEADDEEADLILTLSDGITIGGTDLNWIEVEKIITLDARAYVYDLRVVFSDASVRTITTGDFEVVQNVSQPIT